MLAVLAGSAVTAAAAQDREHDVDGGEAAHAVVFELGAAGDWSVAEGFHPGVTAAFEITPIEDRLEMEFGTTAIRSHGSTEWSVDVLLKKPWQLSRRVEFMAGAGPELVHATGAAALTFWGIEAMADLMVWVRGNIGWYVEPGYEMTMRDGAARRGLGVAAGLLVGR